MPTAKEVDDACRLGFFVFVKNRAQIQGAQNHYHGVPAKPGTVWCSMRKTGLWEEHEATKIVITTELFSKEKTMLRAVESGPKKSGKRGTGRPGLPSEKKAAGNGKAEGEKSEDKLPVEAAPTEKPEKDKKKKGKSGTETVSRTTPKQGELPGVQVSKRKIQEIETLADTYEEKMLAEKRAKEDREDAQQNLLVSMHKHGRMSYSRKTWAKVEVVGSKERIKFKREKNTIKE